MPDLPRVDLLLRNGRIWTGCEDLTDHPAEVGALAVRDGEVVAVGGDLDRLASESKRVVDLEGRRVVPGLVDSHTHAVRAGLTWSRSLHWDGMRTLADCLESVREYAARLPAGSWISVVGGWHGHQLAEGRPPTRGELDAAAPDHPVYVQELYERGTLNTSGLRSCGWDDSSADPPGGTLVRSPEGRLTGEVRGMGALAVPLGAALSTDEAEQVAGMRAMVRDFAAVGLTGVHDGFGLMITPEDHRPLYALWRDGELDLRTRLFLSAWEAGHEVGNVEEVLRQGHPFFGDDMLRVVGIGEVAHLGCHDFEGLQPMEITDDAFDDLSRISLACARAGWPMSVHAVRDATLGRILDAWEEVETQTGGVRGRRWSIVHADEASPENLDRIARLGAGILVQNRIMLSADKYADAWGEVATRRLPPIGDMRERGIVLGAGTDGTRANWYSPWASLWWLVTGRPVGRGPERDVQHRMSVMDALAAYTRGSAWFSREEHRRGRLAPGYLADLCVPAEDPFECEVDRLRDLWSDLTIVGGRVTHAAGGFAGLCL